MRSMLVDIDGNTGNNDIAIPGKSDALTVFRTVVIFQDQRSMYLKETRVCDLGYATRARAGH